MFDISWGFLFDSLTVAMLIVVTCVSTVVHFYSQGYMEHDPHLPRFMSYLSLFTFFMLILVTADNLIQMFVGWEGVGLCSYLLINFWFTRLQANKAAIKAVIVNRVGDVGLVLGILIIFKKYKTVNYLTLFNLILFEALLKSNGNFLDVNLNILQYENLTFYICICLFIGAVGKSAQIGLHTWLPDAMEGPTPVSALIHAATMVTAGVFLIIRCSPIFELAPTSLIIVTCIGALTAFFAASVALVQNDLKKVIAYSTCSQLGYMVFACGTSNYAVSFFHLANHAFFKALLFLTAGSVIHAMANEQDMRKMGGLVNVLPYTYALMYIGSLSLMGFPFLTGFYSKDAILELALAKYTLSSHFAYWLGTFSAFLTSFYSTRLLYLTFLKKTSSYKKSMEGAHDMPPIMGFPLFPLIFGSIFIGYLTRDLFIGVGTDYWGNSIYTLDKNIIIFDAEFLKVNLKLIPVIFSTTGLISGFIYYKSFAFNDLKVKGLIIFLYTFLNKKWYIDRIYNSTINQAVLYSGYNLTYKTVDRGLIEYLGPHGLSQTVYSKELNLNNIQTGLIYNYTFLMLTGVLLLTFILIIIGNLGIVPIALIFVLFVYIFLNKN